MESIEKMMEQSEIGFAKHKMIYDEQGKPTDYCFLSVNTAFERLTGLKREELLNQRFTQVIPKITDEDFDWMGYYGKVVSDGKKCFFEHYSPPLDKWYRVEVFSSEEDCFTTLFTAITHERELTDASKSFLKELRNESGAINFTDMVDMLIENHIGLQKLAENERQLRESKQQLDTIVSNSPTVIYTYRIDNNGNPLITFINGDVQKILGYDPQVFVHDLPLFKSCIHPDDLHIWQKKLSKHNITCEYRFKDKEGNFHWLLDKQKVLSKEPEFVEIIGTWSDITEKKESLFEAERIKEQYELAVAGSNDGIWDWNLLTNELFLSKRWKEMLGYEDLEIKNEFDSFLSLIYEEDFSRVNEFVRCYLEGEIEQYAIEFRMKHKNGSLVWILAKGEALREVNGKPYRMAGSHSDITKRKEAEQQLKENQIRLEYAMDSGDHGFWDMNLDTDEIYCSPRYYTMLGYEPDEFTLTQDVWRSLIHPDDRPSVPVIRKYLEKQEQSELYFRLKCKDGSYKWIASRAKGHERDVQGNPHRAVGVHVDIDELKRKTEALKESHRMAKMGRWDYYHKQDCLKWSEGIFEIFEMDPTIFEANYQAFLERVHPDEREGVTRSWENSIANHQAYDIEHRLLLDDGRIKWVKEVCYTEYDENGHPQHSVGIIQDITERKQAEDKLRESEGKLSALFAAMTEMIVLHEMVFDDANKPVNYRITDCNAAFTSITGIHREEAVGKLATELYSTPKPPYLDEFSRVAITGKPYRYETYFEPMKKHFDISVISHGINRFATITTDISKQKEFQQKLEIAKEQAESANQAKSMFLANMNHELRTPLNGIIGFTDILRNTPLNKEQHEYADIVYTSGKHLADIISNILDLSRIEAGKFELNSKKTDLKDLVDKTLSIVRPKSKQKGLTLCASIDNDVPKTVEVDGFRLRQVLINLIANAVKFTNEGSVQITVRLQERQSDKARLLFKVTDTGMGIKQEEQTKIFEAFQQADMAYSKKAEGTGLGLAISKKILELMGGALELNSVYGEGSTFYFELLLPCELEQVADLAQTEYESMDEQAVFTNKKILIAEDNPTNMHYVQAAIAMFSKDTRIIKAKDGNEAYHFYREHQPDLILMDIRMPHADGYQATAMIRCEDKQIPIIAMTAKAFEEDKEKCLAAGMNDFITKPVSLEQLKEAIIKHL